MSERYRTYQSTCDGKTKYMSRREARAQRNRVHTDGHLSVYLCPFCTRYHLGHPRWEAQPTADEPSLLDAAQAAARVLGVSIDEALELLEGAP